MALRPSQLVRCSECLAEARHCFCARFEPIETRTRVVLFMHRQEFSRTTNTGRLLVRSLPNLEHIARAVRDPVPYVLPEGAHGLVLDPHATRELSPADAVPGATLLVPDGTWSQARRMVKKEPAFFDATRVRLPPGPESIYMLRREPDPTHLCTLEAVARALGILEGKEVETRLLDLLRTMVTCAMKTRGQLLPEGYHDPSS